MDTNILFFSIQLLVIVIVDISYINKIIVIEVPMKCDFVFICKLKFDSRVSF